MKFCPNCNNAFIIVRQNEVPQSVLESIEEKNVLSASDTSSYTSESEKSEVAKQKNGSTNTGVIGSNKAFYKCTNCGYIEPIEQGEMLISRMAVGSHNMEEEYINHDIYKEMVNDLTLPHTRNYICPNKTCKSQNEYKYRDAVMFKPNRQSYAIKYVCTACNTVW